MKNYSIARSRRLRSTPYTSRIEKQGVTAYTCLLYTSPSPRDRQKSRMPSSA